MDFSSFFFASERIPQTLFDVGAKDLEFPDDLDDSCADLLDPKTPVYDEFWTLGADPFGDLLAIPDEELGLSDSSSDLEPPALRWDSLILQREPATELHSVAAWNEHEERHASYQRALYYQVNASDQVDAAQSTTSKRKPAKFEKFACTFCTRKFGSEATLKYHAFTHANARQTQTHSCPHCAYTYRSKCELTRHFKRCHSDHLFTCHLCAQIFVSFLEYDAHVAAKACQIYACKSCDASFMRARPFKRHLLVHLLGKDKYREYEKNLSTHIASKKGNVGDKAHHSRMNIASRKDVLHHNQDSRTHIASKKDDVCDIKHRSRMNIASKKDDVGNIKHLSRMHIASKKGVLVHNQNSRTHIAGKQDLPDIKQDPSEHIVPKGHCCALCSSCFEARSKLSRHMRLKHAPHRFSCPSCGKRFVRADHFQIHMRRHNNQKPCACDFCDKRFCQKSDLNRHRKYVHLGSKRKTAKTGLGM